MNIFGKVFRIKKTRNFITPNIQSKSTKIIQTNNYYKTLYCFQKNMITI